MTGNTTENSNGQAQSQSSVRGHTRTVNGRTQKVRSHSRKTNWTDAKKKAVAAGAGGAVFLATAFELGFQVATAILLIIGAIIGVIFTVANGGSRGTKRGKAVSRRLLAPQNKQARKKNKNRGAFSCKRCGGRYSNVVTHVCQIKWSKTNTQKSRQRSKGKTTAGRK